MTIKEINKEIAQLRQEAQIKVDELVDKRDKLIISQNKQWYFKFIDNNGNKAIFKIVTLHLDYVNGDIFAYSGKLMTTAPSYHDDYMISTSNINNLEYITKEEFEELLNKGLELIRKDVI